MSKKKAVKQRFCKWLETVRKEGGTNNVSESEKTAGSDSR